MDVPDINIQTPVSGSGSYGQIICLLILHQSTEYIYAFLPLFLIGLAHGKRIGHAEAGGPETATEKNSYIVNHTHQSTAW